MSENKIPPLATLVQISEFVRGQTPDVTDYRVEVDGAESPFLRLKPSAASPSSLDILMKMFRLPGFFRLILASRF